MSRAGAARASIDVHAKVPSAGAGATRCAMLGPDQLSTTAKRVVALKTCAASKLFRRSGVVMAASAWVLARRGRCGPCIALMTKKVDKTFHEREIWAVKKLARRALSLPQIAYWSYPRIFSSYDALPRKLAAAPLRTSAAKCRAANGASGPAAPLRPPEHPAAPAPDLPFIDNRLRHCIGPQVECNALKRLRRHPLRHLRRCRPLRRHPLRLRRPRHHHRTPPPPSPPPPSPPLPLPSPPSTPPSHFSAAALSSATLDSAVSPTAPTTTASTASIASTLRSTAAFSTAAFPTAAISAAALAAAIDPSTPPSPPPPPPPPPPSPRSPYANPSSTATRTARPPPVWCFWKVGGDSLERPKSSDPMGRTAAARAAASTPCAYR